VSLSNLVKVSEEDLAWYYPGIEPVEVARRWVKLGPAVVVVTLGGEGAVAVRCNGVELRIPGVPVKVADTIGAGDTFTGALLDGLASAGVVNNQTLTDLPDADLLAALNWAAKAAAITCSRPGANPPTRTELLT